MVLLLAAIFLEPQRAALVQDQLGPALGVRGGPLCSASVEIARLGRHGPSASERVHRGPKSKAKSVVMTEEGAKRAKRVIREAF